MKTRIEGCERGDDVQIDGVTLPAWKRGFEIYITLIDLLDSQLFKVTRSALATQFKHAGVKKYKAMRTQYEEGQRVACSFISLYELNGIIRHYNKERGKEDADTKEVSEKMVLQAIAEDAELLSAMEKAAAGYKELQSHMLELHCSIAEHEKQLEKAKKALPNIQERIESFGNAIVNRDLRKLNSLNELWQSIDGFPKLPEPAGEEMASEAADPEAPDMLAQRVDDTFEDSEAYLKEIHTLAADLGDRKRLLKPNVVPSHIYGSIRGDWNELLKGDLSKMGFHVHEIPTASFIRSANNIEMASAAYHFCYGYYSNAIHKLSKEA